MDRRQALSAVALLIGGTIVGGEMFLSGCKTERKEGVFAADDVAFLDEVGETILPATAASPGAKAAKIGEFMKMFVTDCYEPEDLKIFTDGIGKINEESNKKFSKDFMQLSADEKTSLLSELDKTSRAEQMTSNNAALSVEENHQMALEQNFSGKNQKAIKYRNNPTYYFILMKQLAMLGYFTSKIASTTALRYEPVPGRYDGNYPYKKGDKAWATN